MMNAGVLDYRAFGSCQSHPSPIPEAPPISRCGSFQRFPSSSPVSPPTDISLPTQTHGMFYDSLSAILLAADFNQLLKKVPTLPIASQTQIVVLNLVSHQTPPIMPQAV